jgi:hypothetical protein
MLNNSEISHQSKKSLCLENSEIDEIVNKIKKNGICKLSGYLTADIVKEIKSSAQLITSKKEIFKLNNKATIKSNFYQRVIEFEHPFLISKGAFNFILRSDFISIFEKYIGEDVRIHHTIFQRSLKNENPSLGLHIDTGSVKSLNGNKQFSDKRLRCIVYLSDVNEETGGGLGYVPGSLIKASEISEAINVNKLDEIINIKKNENKYKKISVQGQAGDILLFDTFGFHCPSPIFKERLVMNIWFCGQSFLGRIPSLIFDLDLLRYFSNKNKFSLEKAILLFGSAKILDKDIENYKFYQSSNFNNNFFLKFQKLLLNSFKVRWK